MSDSVPALFALALHHAVPDLDEAERFFTGVLGFAARRRGHGWVVVDNGALGIRLVASEGVLAPPPLPIELATNDVEATASWLEGRPGVVARSSNQWVSPERKECRLSTRHGITLVVARDYDEDALGVVPPLPTSLLWAAEADELTRSALREVPLAFRADARRRAVEAAEAATIRSGSVEVTPDEAARSLIRVTPLFRRPEMRAWLEARGWAVPEEDDV